MKKLQKYLTLCDMLIVGLLTLLPLDIWMELGDMETADAVWSELMSV